MTKNYKVAIDISPIYDGNSVRGVGYYTKNLVSAIHQELSHNQEFSNFKIILITDKNLIDDSFNLIHYPFFDPFKLTLPSSIDIPYIVTVHDLIPRIFKSHFPVGIRGEINWLIQKYRLKKAKYIISPSFSAKYSMAPILGYPEDKIFVTHEAADDSFKVIKDFKLLKNIKQKYRLPDKFILYLGDINWNKNTPNLASACLKLNYPLVVVGSSATKQTPIHPWTESIHQLQSMANKHPKKIILTGFVPDDDLPSIFNLATIYCQPSYAEGFGLPLIQAMQSGTPTLLANTTSLPEISDLSGLYFNPYSRISLRKKLKKLWTSTNLRQQYSKLGLVRSTVFSWQKTAIETLNLYRLALMDEK